MRARLETVRAIVYLSSATLRAQQSDADTDVALVLQHSVGDVLAREIETLDIVVAGTPHVRSATPDRGAL
jgi:hypothetical protein